MKTLNQYNTASYARKLMNQHNLTDWVFQFDRAKRRAGCCKHRRKVISLSYFFVVRNNDDEIKDIILHEIAHALAGPKQGHNNYWKSICRRIGARPERCYDSDKVDMPEPRLKAICGGCKKVFKRHRQVSRGKWRYCLACGPDRGRLTFR